VHLAPTDREIDSLEDFLTLDGDVKALDDELFCCGHGGL
jgi:hypothetical protein